MIKEVIFMSLTRASKTTISVVILSLLITMFIASEAMAQQQYCECYDTVRTVAVRRAPVRRVAYRRAKVKRSYRVARVRRAPLPVARVAGYSYARNDCDDVVYTPATRLVVTEPVYTSSYAVGYYDPERIGRGWGRRDGFKDGYKAALKGRVYDVENNGDFRDANNGYKKRFGSKFLYKAAYREGYARGYDTGWRSINGPGTTYGAVRY
jgi:hypothetical protein